MVRKSEEDQRNTVQSLALASKPIKYFLKSLFGCVVLLVFADYKRNFVSFLDCDWHRHWT